MCYDDEHDVDNNIVNHLLHNHSHRMHNDHASCQYKQHDDDNDDDDAHPAIEPSRRLDT